MRRALELMMLICGASAMAYGLNLALWNIHDPLALGLGGGGLAAVVIGLSFDWVLSKIKRPASAPSAGRGPLATATLAFSDGKTPEIVLRDQGLEVVADKDGTIRFKLARTHNADRLVCRVSGAQRAYFNTLRQTRQDTAIKLVGPMPPLVRLELWDDARLKESA